MTCYMEHMHKLKANEYEETKKAIRHKTKLQIPARVTIATNLLIFSIINFKAPITVI